MNTRTKAAKKPWEKLGISRSKYFGDKRKAKAIARRTATLAAALTGRLGEAAGAAATARQVGKQPPLLMEHTGKHWRPVTAGMAAVAEAALPEAIETIKRNADQLKSVDEAVNLELARQLRFMLLAGSGPMTLNLTGTARVALFTFLQKGLEAPS